MKTKILVIPINLGYSIDDIIHTDLIELTQESQQQLNKAINIAKAVQAVKDQKQQLVAEKITRFQEALEKSYTMIQESGQVGCPLTEIKEVISKYDISLSTLTTKLKCMLKERQPNHDLEKVRRNNIQYYKFISLN